MPHPSYLSQGGREHLRTMRRRDIDDQIQQFRERDGTVSNAEYEEAKNELAFTEGCILTPDNMINKAIILEKKRGDGSTVEVGTTIAVKDQDGRRLKHTIDGSAEAEPSQGNISNVSLIGQSLLDKRVGEITEVNVPSGKIRLEVMAID